MKFKTEYFQIFIILLIVSQLGNVLNKSWKRPLYLPKHSFIQKYLNRNTTVTNTTNHFVVNLHPGIFPKNVTFLPNFNIQMKDKATYAKHEKCKIETGLLYLLKMDQVIDPNDKSKHIQGLTCKPVFISLNEKTFSVQTNEVPNSLIQAIILEKISRVTQTYKGTTCFDIIEEKKELSPLQLCAETKDEMDQWIVGILEFKECLLREKFELIDANANAFAKKDEAPKEDVKNGKGIVPPKAPKRVLNPLSTKEVPIKPVVVPDALYYINTFAPTSEVQEITETDEVLTKILNTQKREELAQRQIRRQIEDKIRKVKEAHQKILLEQKKIAKKNASNKKKEIALASQRIENLAKKQQKGILNKALKDMQTVNVINLFKLNFF